MTFYSTLHVVNILAYKNMGNAFDYVGTKLIPSSWKRLHRSMTKIRLHKVPLKCPPLESGEISFRPISKAQQANLPACF